MLGFLLYSCHWKCPRYCRQHPRQTLRAATRGLRHKCWWLQRWQLWPSLLLRWEKQARAWDRSSIHRQRWYLWWCCYGISWIGSTLRLRKCYIQEHHPIQGCPWQVASRYCYRGLRHIVPAVQKRHPLQKLRPVIGPCRHRRRLRQQQKRWFRQRLRPRQKLLGQNMGFERLHQDRFKR